MTTLRRASDWLLPAIRPLAPLALAVLLLLGAAIAPGCASSSRERPLDAPEVTIAPYAPGIGETLWVVAPLRNESGTSLVRSDQVTDAVIAAVAEVRGVRTLPYDRTTAAMRAMGLESIDTPAQALALARTLGADGVIVGTITAWDPYNPPAIGLNLALLATESALANVDPRALIAAPTDGAPVSMGLAADLPMAIVSEHLDARNHQVLSDLRSYALGRHDRRDALSWEVYLASMPLYTKFAAHHAVAGLVREEWIRLAQAVPPPANPTVP
ncbi:MAG: hypothetical protein R3B68_05870 [Phycisphaerales bacterium]